MVAHKVNGMGGFDETLKRYLSFFQFMTRFVPLCKVYPLETVPSLGNGAICDFLWNSKWNDLLFC
jgi:hypothetical protein